MSDQTVIALLGIFPAMGGLNSTTPFTVGATNDLDSIGSGAYMQVELA